jgi:hypothetical protein
VGQEARKRQEWLLLFVMIEEARKDQGEREPRAVGATFSSCLETIVANLSTGTYERSWAQARIR